jgi:hypothetical protein
MTTRTKPTPQTETERLFSDLDKPSLHALSYALRHPDTWPEGFIWDYSQCTQCAMGLAHQLWSKLVPETNNETAASVMARQFAIPYSAAQNIFLGQGSWCPRKERTTGVLWWKQTNRVLNLSAVTPEMVADQIDAHLGHAS